MRLQQLFAIGNTALFQHRGGDVNVTDETGPFFFVEPKIVDPDLIDPNVACPA